jgi:hypothetical protein
MPAIHHARSRPRIRSVASLLAHVGVALTVAACGADTAETIDREAFIETYVDLRLAALDSDSLRLSAEDREEVLGRHGVTAADLETFAEVHATDLDFMRDVWTEVEVRLDLMPER